MRGITTVALAVAANVTATGNGAAVNVGEYHSFAKLVLNAKGVNAGTNTITLQHSHDGSTGWNDTGDAFAAVGTSDSYQEILINADKLRKFVRVVDTLAGGANTSIRAVTLVGSKKAS